MLRPLTRWAPVPTLGAVKADNDASLVYVAVRREFWLNDRWAIIPSFGTGACEEGRGIDPGQSLEFRSGLETARRFDNDVRIGVAVFHVSNGGLSKRNPGAEAVVLSLSVPLRRADRPHRVTMDGQGPDIGTSP